MSGAVSQMTADAAAPRSTRAMLISGASALGVVTVVERGCNFAANLLAARFAGSQTFGAYALALTTANNVATYAGAGIGTTANRFAGRYPRGSAGYTALVRSLALVSLASAALAIVLLLAGAGPLARVLLRNDGLTPLLQIAAVSAGVMIALECLRGFLIGERRYSGLAALALSSGLLLVVVLPVTAGIGAMWMIAGHAAASSVAVACCLFFARERRVVAPIETQPEIDASGNDELPNVRTIWRFGLVQFAGVVGLNAAGWWMTALVARGDPTLAQAGLFAVASQLRNFTSLGPNLFNQSSYALLADEQEGAAVRRRTVLLHCTFYAGILSLLVAGTLAAAIGWLMPAVFGPSFGGGGLAASLAMITAIVHTTSAPTSARLTIVSLRYTGAINALWAMLTIAGATLLVPRWGAAAAMGVYFSVHVVSAFLVFMALRRIEAPPPGLATLLFGTLGLAAVLAGLAVLREWSPAEGTQWSLLLLAVTIAGTAALAARGIARGWLPRPSEAWGLTTSLGRASLRRSS